MSSQPGKNCEPHVRNRKELVKRPTVVISILRDSLFDSVSSGLSHRWDIDKNSASQTKLSAEKSDVNTVKFMHFCFLAYLVLVVNICFFSNSRARRAKPTK